MVTSRRQPRLPSESFPAHVEALAHDGRGIAHRDGKAVFIQGALPGEAIRFKLTARHSGYDEGEVVEVSCPSPDRVEPRCRYFDICGGCSLQYLNAVKQVASKQDWLLENLSRIGKVTPPQVLEPLFGSC